MPRILDAEMPENGLKNCKIAKPIVRKAIRMTRKTLGTKQRDGESVGNVEGKRFKEGGQRNVSKDLIFLKPKDQKQRRKYLDDDGVYRYPDQREICDQKSKKGRDEYQRRKFVMFNRQKGLCGLQISPQCKSNGGKMSKLYCQFGHEVSRGGGKQDDRIEIDGKPHNRALCPWCNSLQGSRKMSIFIDPLESF